MSQDDEDLPGITEADTSTRVSGRMLLLLADLFRFHGLDVAEHVKGLPSVDRPGPPPRWISWDDYVDLTERLGRACGGPEGVARAMRGVPKDAYAELRSARAFFPEPAAFFAFYSHQIMPSMTPGFDFAMEELGGQRWRVRYEVREGVRSTEWFLCGTKVLVELFPTHFDLPEAKTEVLTLSARLLDMIVAFPAVDPANRWGGRLALRKPSDLEEPPSSSGTLTPREREVLSLLTEGLTNAEIASTLGTATNTVRHQVASIMDKMAAANRTELAVRAVRNP
jgi:DNA-binding CsgD family transcriptional regulator